MQTVISIAQIILAVAVAATADAVATLWANSSNKFSVYLLLIFILGPLVFITFGIVTTKNGLSITSGVVNSLLVVTSILVGLFFFNEWGKITTSQLIGIFLAFIGICLMLFTKK